MSNPEKIALTILTNRRGRAEIDRERKVAKFYSHFPELEALDREIRIETAEQLLAIADHPGEVIDRARLNELKENRREYLRARSIPMDFDQVVPFCRICGDTGYVEGKPCTCLRTLMIPYLYEASGLSLYPEAIFSSYTDQLYSDPTRMNALRDVAESYAETFPGQQKNFLFWGDPGTGKTFLAACIADKVLHKGLAVSFLRIGEILELLSTYRTLTNAYSPDEERLAAVTEKRNLILNGDLLVIDELGLEPTGANTNADLLSVIGTRRQQNLATVITTNLSLQDIQRRYDNRLYSRLFGDYQALRFEGRDIRTSPLYRAGRI